MNSISLPVRIEIGTIVKAARNINKAFGTDVDSNNAMVSKIYEKEIIIFKMKSPIMMN